MTPTEDPQSFVPSDSTWGRKNNDFDRRALRQYHSALISLMSLGEWLSICLALTIAGLAIFTVLNINYEDAIFSDGTPRSCKLDGLTGEIINVN